MNQLRRHPVFVSLLVMTVLSLALTRDRPTPLDVQMQSKKVTYQRQIDCAFENLKHMATPGYKSRTVSDSGRFSSSFGQGTIFRTTTATHLAINGRGFFTLEGQLYTRDGRFLFQEGVLRHESGHALLGYPLDSQSGICGELEPVALPLDPQTKLYRGEFTGYEFDSLGRLYGVHTLTDPVTGQQLSATTPLYQVQLCLFETPAHLEPVGDTLFRAGKDSGKPLAAYAGFGTLGQICPASLELSNVESNLETTLISRAKTAYMKTTQGTLFLRGELSRETLELLVRRGIVYRSEEGMLTLEGDSREHLLRSLNAALNECDGGKEADTLLQCMAKLEPRFVAP